MATERVITGKKYRILSSVSDKVWDVISFFTKSSDVWNNNDKNLQTTVGSITGISSSLTSTSSTVAASAAAVKALNDKIVELNSNLNNKPYVIFGVTSSVSSGSVIPVIASSESVSNDSITVPVTGTYNFIYMATGGTVTYGISMMPYVNGINRDVSGGNCLGNTKQITTTLNLTKGDVITCKSYSAASHDQKVRGFISICLQ